MQEDDLGGIEEPWLRLKTELGRVWRFTSTYLLVDEIRSVDSSLSSTGWKVSKTQFSAIRPASSSPPPHPRLSSSSLGSPSMAIIS